MTEDFAPTRTLLTILFLLGGLWIAGTTVTAFLNSESLGLQLTAWALLRGAMTGLSVMAAAKIGIAITYICDNTAVVAVKVRADAKIVK